MYKHIDKAGCISFEARVQIVSPKLKFKNDQVSSGPLSPVSSSALTSNAAGKLDVLGHDGDSLGMDSTEIGILEEANEVGL